MEDNSTLILDEQFAEEPEFNPEENLASAGKRFANYILDTLGFYIFIFVFMFGVGSFFPDAFLFTDDDDPIFTFIALAIFAVYYIVFEYFFQRTPAKFLTRCKVVSIDGTKPSLGQCIGRTFSRFVPFEAFSFLGDFPVGWHDRWPKTRVINT